MLVPTPEQLAALDTGDHITKDYKNELARMGRASLYFFAKYIFGSKGLNERAHLPLCDAAQKIIVTPNAIGVFEDPRATGKSFAITIPGPAWCLIQNEKECQRKGWLKLGPSASVAVASYKTGISSIFTNDTRTRMEEQPLFQWLYGDLVPSQGGKSVTWSKEQFTVNRSEGSGYSVMALGTESGSTSLHPLCLFIDDLINEINYNSPTEVAAQVEWMEHSNNLTDIVSGSRVVTQNSWSERDVNFALREKNRKNPKSIFFFSRARVVCGVCENGTPLDKWGNPMPCDHPLKERPILDHFLREPDKPYTMADVERLRASLPSNIWWAQHMNNPLARAELKWKEEWLRYYTVEEDNTGRRCAAMIIGVGPLIAGRPDPSRVVFTPVTSMHTVVALDPGIHRPGLACTGRAHVPTVGDVLFVLECSTKKLSPRDQFFLMFDWVVKWGASKVAFENVGLQQYIDNTIPAMAEVYERERGVALPHWLKRPNPQAKRIVGVPVYRREGDKITRTDNGLSPFAEQRLIAVRRDVSDFIDEYVIFDKGKSIDGLEAVLMTIKAWDTKRPPSDAQREVARMEAGKQLDQYVNRMYGAVAYGEGI